MKSYKTVEKKASGEFTEKRSRFIGYICPVTTADEANDFIAEIKQKHWDARHNVYAYILRQDNIKRYSDDGEPQGTAGMPVLDVLEKNGVCDICVVVTRYFGGVLLGTGGLVRAYTQGAKLAIEAGGIIEMQPSSELEIECDYNLYGKLSTVIMNASGEIISAEFTEKTKIRFLIPSEKEENVKKALFEASNGKITAEKLGEGYKKAKI